MTPQPSLAARIRHREPLLGTLLRMPNEALVELTGLVGMDFVVIDTEHGSADQIALTHHITAATAAGLDVLVRVGHLSEILRVLDLGAAGIIVPHVSSVQQATEVVRTAQYPPHGDRGFATYTRAGRYGLVTAQEHLQTAESGTAIIAMIEDAAGVEAAEQIAAVPGIDGLFVGPADLACALGYPGQPNNPEVQAHIAEVHEAARRGGAAVVSITGDPAVARAQFDQGSTVVIYNVQHALGQLFTSLATGRTTPPPNAGVTASPPVETPTESMDPVVLLAGMFGTEDVWADVADTLAVDLKVRTCRIDMDDSVSGMAESVLAAAPSRFSLVGHSLGAIVALEIVRRAPHRIGKLALLNASGRGPSATQLLAWQNLSDRIVGGEFVGAVRDQAQINLGPAAANEELDVRWREMAHRVGPDGVLRQLTAQANRPDSLPTLAQVTCPVLVISGEVDDVCPPVLQRELADGFTHAHVVTLTGTGHMSPLQSPEEVAGVLGPFLTG